MDSQAASSHKELVHVPAHRIREEDSDMLIHGLTHILTNYQCLVSIMAMVPLLTVIMMVLIVHLQISK
jgi:hypothetical protein